MLFLYTEMVVVSAPKSISAQPERRSLSVSTAFAVTNGAISWSAISILACWKQCSKFLRTEARQGKETGDYTLSVTGNDVKSMTQSLVAESVSISAPDRSSFDIKA